MKNDAHIGIFQQEVQKYVGTTLLIMDKFELIMDT